MHLRPVLALAASLAIPAALYACSDSTFPSALPVYTPPDGSGTADSAPPVTTDAAPTDATPPASDAGDAATDGHAADAGDGASAADASDAAHDAPADATEGG